MLFFKVKKSRSSMEFSIYENFTMQSRSRKVEAVWGYQLMKTLQCHHTERRSEEQQEMMCTDCPAITSPSPCNHQAPVQSLGSCASVQLENLNQMFNLKTSNQMFNSKNLNQMLHLKTLNLYLCNYLTMAANC